MLHNRPVTILQVDDDETNRFLSTLALEREGFDVREAATGAEALRLAAAGPDLIILDVKLPDMSGFEVCRRLKADPATTSIPVLHVSGVARTSGDKTRGLEGGADGYLTKPYDPAELIAQVKALLRMRRAEEAARAAARQWQTSFDAIRDAVCLVDRDGPILRCNRVMAELLDKQPGDVLGCAFEQCVRQALGPAALPPADDPGQAHGRQVRDLRIADRWFHTTADPVLDEQGARTGTVHVWVDISGPMQSEERTRLIIDAAYDAFVAIDADGRIIDWNRQAGITFGWARAEALGQPLAELVIPPRFRDKHRRGLAELLRKGEGPVLNALLEVTALHKDGHEFPAEVTISLVRLGKTCLFDAFARDISARKRAERYQAIEHAVSRVLAESASLGQATVKILQAVCEITGWDTGAVWTVDRQANLLRCTETWSAPVVDVAAFEALTRRLTFAPGAGLPGRVWSTREPVWMADLGREAEFARGQAAAEAGLRAAFAFPVSFGMDVTGVIEFFSRANRQPDDLLAILGAPSSQIGQFMERRHIEETHAERTRLAAFSQDLGMALTQADTLQAMLQRTAETMTRDLGAAFARIWTFNPAAEMLELQASAGLYTHLDGSHARVPLGRLKIGLIAQERRPHATNDVRQDPRIPDKAWVEREGMVAFAGHPLLIAGELVGVMAMFSRQPLTDFTLKALASAADEVALGIQRKRAEKTLMLTRNELSMARQIQERLFPKAAPRVPGFDIAGAAYPAVATGGDYFDYMPMLDGSLAVVIADVSGHGMGPALLMASIRSTFHALTRTHEDVSEILELLNQAVIEDTDDQFVTLVLARLDPRSRSLLYASAGHPAGYVLDALGRVKAELPATGIPLGVLATSRFSTSGPLALEPGDFALFFTDGLLEARAPDGAAFGIARALSIASTCRGNAARQIVHDLYHAVRAFRQEMPQDDDIAVVVIKAEPAS